MEIGWEYMNFRDRAALGFAVAFVVDDWFVGPDPRLNRVGVLL